MIAAPFAKTVFLHKEIWFDQPELARQEYYQKIFGERYSINEFRPITSEPMKRIFVMAYDFISGTVRCQ
ncbi:MAG: hypothetical protein PHY05_00815 [Methanothrix sp.]|nr:hypothetical protein [Methanothrix sp.]